MNIFKFNSYKTFILNRISLLPKKGRGEISRIAKHIGIHTTMVTHVIKGDSHFSMEQTILISEYLGLSNLETEYFVNLVHRDRAGNQKTIKFFNERLFEIRRKALELSRQLDTKNQMSESDRAFYYSSWLYTAIRLLTSISRFQTAESLSLELKIPVEKIKVALDFLVSRGLCTIQNDKIIYGQVPTFLEASSSLATRHHLNWRVKVQSYFDFLRPEDLAFTFPSTTNEATAVEVREILVKAIQDIKKLITPSNAENLYTLNIDWFKIT